MLVHLQPLVMKVNSLLSAASIIYTVILHRFHAVAADDGSFGDTCEMGGGVAGRCEDIETCLQTGGVVRREGVINICRQEASTIYVCCRRPHLIAKELCNVWSHYWRGEDGRCNIEHPLIFGGEAAHIGEFPHAVLVGKKFKQRQINFDCGGSLISPQFILTAAHCLFSPVKGVTYWVKLGEHDLEHDATDEIMDVLKGPIPQTLAGTSNLTFDLRDETRAVAPTEQVIQAKLTLRVLPACLPHRFPVHDYQGETLTVVGWGRTSRGYRMSRLLQKVQVPVVDRLQCSTYRVNDPNLTPMGITEDMLCAGAKGKDTCAGDSGGPLSRQNLRNTSSCEHTVVGVVSYGTGYGYSICGFLGVYTRVSSYLDWITGYIAPNAAGDWYHTKVESSVPASKNDSTVDPRYGHTLPKSRILPHRVFVDAHVHSQNVSVSQNASVSPPTSIPVNRMHESESVPISFKKRQPYRVPLYPLFSELLVSQTSTQSSTKERESTTKDYFPDDMPILFEGF